MDSIFIVFVISLLVTPFPNPVKCEDDFNNQLEIFYRNIINHQTQVKISLDNITKLYTKDTNRKNADGFTNLYATVQMGKSSYGSKDSNPKNADGFANLYATVQMGKSSYGKDLNPKNTIIDGFTNKYVTIQQAKNTIAPNLTVYHQYDDIDHIAKRMPLFFGNQGPSAAIFMKTREINISQQNETLCGSNVAVLGEKRICVSSLRDMMKFVFTEIGRKVKLALTSANKWQLYQVSGSAKIISNKTVGCHKMSIVPFAVYSCHHINNSIVRTVPMIGEDGVALEVVSICHMNTSSWNPNHLVFHILNVKPGVPVCHFLTTDDIVWVQK